MGMEYCTVSHQISQRVGSQRSHPTPQNNSNIPPNGISGLKILAGVVLYLIVS